MTTNKQPENSKQDLIKDKCGIVMPISEIDGCTENHWKEVFTIISQAIEKAGFHSDLVSNSDDVGVIQKRIIQNLYDNPIIVCDVSGKNPNVMLELGMRLAFDKPVIIIKDDKTSYSFDTSPIEHLEYPRDLRFSKIVDFKEHLAEKIKLTHKKAKSDPEFSTFLKHFGSFKVAQIETEVVSKEDYILDELKTLREVVLRNNRNLQNRNTYEISNFERSFDDENKITVCLRDKSSEVIKTILSEIMNVPDIEMVGMERIDDDHSHIEIQINPKIPRIIAIKRIEKVVGDRANYIK